MTTLTPAEIAAARDIAAIIAGLQVDQVASACRRAIHQMAGRLLLADWAPRDAIDHALLFGDRIIAEIGTARMQRAQAQVH
jgi:hypothetical protein